MHASTAEQSLLDPVTQEILTGGFVAVAEEMAAVQYRASFSPIIREMLDYSCGLFDAHARMIAHSDAIPAQLGLMQFALAAALGRQGELRPGDVLLCNDPYQGGTHTPDLEVFSPIFVEGELVGYAGSIAHHIDVGGAMSGDSANCTSVFQEGLIFPGIKLFEAGVRNEGLVELIAANVRAPEATLGDLQAQVAACRRGGERIEDLCARNGKALVVPAMDGLLTLTAAQVSAELERWPTGVVTARGYLDHDVFDPDTPVRIEASVRVDKGKLMVDLSESAPQVRGSINVPWSSTCSAVYFALRAFLGEEARLNDGLMRQAVVVAPMGSILNPRFPAAVGARHATVQRLADVLCQALGELVPSRAVASSHVSFPTFNFQAVDPRTGRLVLIADVIGGGGGARPDAAGDNGIDSYTSNCALLPIEVAEIEYPWTIERTELIDGSGGSGEWPGGKAIRRDYRLLASAAEGPYYIEQSKDSTAAQGLNGGGAGRPARVRLQKTTGEWVDLPPKGYLRISQGEVISFESAGGGGYGRPTTDDLARNGARSREGTS
jgi:N-methylhydantoinase B